MQLNQNKLKIYDCLRCGWQWASRALEAPKSCAKCKNRGWQTQAPPKDVNNCKEQKLHKKYGFDELRPGDTKIYKWLFHADGSPDFRANGSRYASLRQYQRRSGRVFHAHPDITQGLVVTRIS